MLKKIHSLVFIAVLFLFVVGGLSAQTPRELRFGTSVSGNFWGGEEYWFSVRPSETGFAIVESLGDIDTYMEAYDAYYNLISSNDDGGENLNAKLRVFAEPGKTYLFKLRGYSSDTSGPFDIRASFIPVSQAVDLRFGAPFTGRLREGEEQWFRVLPSEPGFAVVETSGDFDTYLEAYGDGMLIGENDDWGDSQNSRLEILFEANKVYYILLRGYNSSASGSYIIRADFEPVPPDTERNTEISRAVTIRLGEALPVFFRSPDESRWYRYDISRASTLFVVQTRGDMDMRMFLYDARGNLIAEDDDSGENMNSLISQRLNSGTVYIEVRPYSGRTGRCTLHAEIR